jgi:hypothetical protein
MRKLVGNITKQCFLSDGLLAWLYRNDARTLRLTEHLPFDLLNMRVVEGGTVEGDPAHPDMVTVTVDPGQACLLVLQQSRAAGYRWSLPSSQNAGAGVENGVERKYAEAFLEDI